MLHKMYKVTFSQDILDLMNKVGRLFFLITLFSLVGFTVDALAAKRGFKGLFSSYRQPRFTENEGRDTDFGLDLLLSTMLPLTPVISSQEVINGPIAPLQSSMFFNGESSLFVSLNYSWQFFASIGYYTYESRKQSAPSASSISSALVSFHQFELTAIPIVAGVRYRLTQDDFVPYFGAGIGMSRVTRHSFYDYVATGPDGKPLENETIENAVTAEVMAGVEFYFTSRAGIRLEASAYYMHLTATQWRPGVDPKTNTWMYAGANPWFVRYASGLFLLF